MNLLRPTLVMGIMASIASLAFGQSAMDFRAAATKAFPATVAVTAGAEEGHARTGQSPRLEHPERFLRPMLRPGDRSLTLFRDGERHPFGPAVGFAVAPDLVIVATTGTTGDVVHLHAIDQENIPGKIIASDYVVGLSAIRLDKNLFAPLSISHRTLEPGQPVLITEMSDVGEVNAHGAMISSYATTSKPDRGMVHRIDTSNGDLASGSPVVDEIGDLVGVVLSTQSGAVCLPASSLSRLVETTQSESPSDLYPGRLGVVLGNSGDTLITDLASESPAGKAGLKAGDRIISVGGQSTATTGDVIATVAIHRGGDTVEIVVDRDGAESRFDVVLEAGKSQRGQMPSLFPPPMQMWRLENGKLVPMEETLGNAVQPGVAPRMPKMNGANSNDHILISPPELRGITVERSGLDETLRRVQKQLEQTQKSQEDFAQKLRELNSHTDANQDQPRSDKADFEKLQRLIESLQQEIRSLKSDRD